MRKGDSIAISSNQPKPKGLEAGIARKGRNRRIYRVSRFVLPKIRRNWLVVAKGQILPHDPLRPLLEEDFKVRFCHGGYNIRYYMADRSLATVTVRGVVRQRRHIVAGFYPSCGMALAVAHYLNESPRPFGWHWGESTGRQDRNRPGSRKKERVTQV
mgnify:CR=1 FL=1